MIIVTGSYRVPADERDRFISSKLEQMATSRDEAGCVEYAYSADAEHPDLVRLIELWESMADLEAHVQRLRSDPPGAPGVEVVSSTFAVFEGAPARMPGV